MEKTYRHFQEQLDLLSEKILCLGGMVEEAIGKSVRALVNRDSGLARDVIENDGEVDRMELEIDELCVGLLALQQPMARDLRFITTAMKITPDLERIADHAVNISERAIELNREPPLAPLIDIPAMAARAQEMVRGSLDALVRRDGAAAREIIAMDDELDIRMEQVFRSLLSYMLEDPATISRALRLSFVAKYFERIGDQATNLCEQIVFMSEAQVIKHAQVNSNEEEEPAG
jgi:phosphate transport system protein